MVKKSGLALWSLLTVLPILALAVGFSLSPQAVGSAQAGIEYPWCAVYSESTVGATNCGFSTYAQCRATLAGLGGMCIENPAYPSPAPAPRKPRKSRH